MLGDHLGADRDRRAGHRGRTPATPRCPAVRRYPASTQGRPFPAGLGSRRGGARKHPAATVADLSTAASAAVSDVESAGRSSTTGRAARRRRRTPPRGAALESAPVAVHRGERRGLGNSGGGAATFVLDPEVVVRRDRVTGARPSLAEGPSRSARRRNPRPAASTIRCLDPRATSRARGCRPWQTHRPPPAGAGKVVNKCGSGWSAVADAPSAPTRCGKRGQQVRRWLERRGRRAVRPSTGATAQRGRGRSTLFPPRRPPIDKLCSAGGRSGPRPEPVLAAITLVGRCRRRAAVDAVPASGAVGRVHEGTFGDHRRCPNPAELTAPGSVWSPNARWARIRTHWNALGRAQSVSIDGGYSPWEAHECHSKGNRRPAK